MQEVIIVRHGEAEHLISGIGGGWFDTPLTSVGREQAHVTGQLLSKLLHQCDFNFLCSDLSRAHETATIIGQHLSKQPIANQELRGLSFGAAGALTKDEADKIKLPITLPLFDWIPYPEAESWKMMYDRVAKFMESVITINNSTNKTVIVAHGHSTISILYWWLGFSRQILTKLPKVSFEVEPCSITRLTWDVQRSKRIVETINYTLHTNELFNK
jgi:probable phosphoglycerate mutase